MHNIGAQRSAPQGHDSAAGQVPSLVIQPWQIRADLGAGFGGRQRAPPISAVQLLRMGSREGLLHKWEVSEMSCRKKLLSYISTAGIKNAGFPKWTLCLWYEWNAMSGALGHELDGERRGGGVNRGHWTSWHLHIPASHWWRFLLLLVCLTVLIGMLYVCSRTNVHSRLSLKSERNRNFHLNSTDFCYLSQVPIGTFSAALDFRSDSRAMYPEDQQGRPRVREVGQAGRRLSALTRAGESGKLHCCHESSFKNLHSHFASQRLFRNEKNQATSGTFEQNVCVHFIIKNCVW